MPSQREQYGDIVHRFIGTGRSLCKITLMPFTFINNSMIILRGPIWFFIFKSVSFFAVLPKLFYTQLRLCGNPRVPCASSYCGSDPSPKIPVNVLYSRNIVKSCFWGPSEAEGPQQHSTLLLPLNECSPFGKNFLPFRDEEILPLTEIFYLGKSMWDIEVQDMIWLDWLPLFIGNIYELTTYACIATWEV
jgi:hypothetical protein